MANINEILARAAALRDETALNSIDPERAGGIMYDTLMAMNELWLQQGAALVISKIYASVAAMNADTSPVSDLTGQPIRPGMIVVIASSDSDNGSVYRYNGTSSPRWSLVGKIGNLEPVDSLDSDSTQFPLAAHQGKVLDSKISQLGLEIDGNTVKPPVFINGFIGTNGNFVPNDNYRCSSFLPCELIAYIANETDAKLNVIYYDEEKTFQQYSYDNIVNDKLYLREGYKYFRYWATAENIGHNTLIPIKDEFAPIKNELENLDLLTLQLVKWTQYSGSISLFSEVDDSTITAVIGESTTEITIKSLVFTDKIRNVGYIAPAQATLTVSSDSNLVVLGVIAGGSSDRYGYFSSNNGSSIGENEVFRPICVCRLYNGEFKIISGIIYDALLENELNERIDVTSSNTVKEPSFKSGFIDNNGNWHDNSGYRCSGLLPLDLIGGLKSSVAQNINLNYYDADGSYAEAQVIPFVNGVAKPTKKHKYFRFWSTTADIASVSIIWIKEYFEEQVSDIEEQIAGLEFYDSKPSNIVYSNKFLSLDKLGAINLTNNQAAVPSEVLSLETNGIGISQNYAFWPLLDSRINNCWTRIVINTASASSFVLKNYGMENGAQGLTELANFNIAGNTVQLYSKSAVSYTFNSNSDYRIDLHRVDKFNQLFITDLKTGITTSIDSYAGASSGNSGLMYDIVSVGTSDQDSIIVKSYNIESGVDRPRLMIFGDSLTVGFDATCVNGVNTNCYAYKVGEASGMKWLSSGRGGGSFPGILGGTDDLGFSYEGRLWKEIKAIRPDYVMVTLGTNGSGTYANYKSVIDLILKAGATPILNTLPIRADVDHIHNVSFIVSANEAIMQIWRDYGINGARFDLATSLNNDGDTINSAMFSDDYIHPNDTGHNAMYQRVLVDCPYLFLND